MNIRYLTGTQLAAANELAVARGYNCTLDASLVSGLSPTGRYPITFEMLHRHAVGALNPSHVRCEVRFEAGSAALDVDEDLFNTLDSVEVPDSWVVGVSKPSRN